MGTDYVDWQTQSTYDAIVLRCRNLIPSIDIEKHIKSGTLWVSDNKLDGISFEPVNTSDLLAELGGRMKIPGATPIPIPGSGPLAFDNTRRPRPANASMMSMKEDPDNWALKCSFGATKGEGFREQWRPPPISRDDLLPIARYGSDRISLGFGETGKRLVFTSLHVAVEPKLCKMHIDERGFVLSVPEGAVVTPTFYGHLVNELLLKSEFRDWLKGKLGDQLLGKIVVGIVNRLSLRFADAENHFAGLSNRVNSISGIQDVGGIAKAFMPIGASFDIARLRDSTVQANYYSYDGQRTLTVSWGGTFDAFGSK